MREKLIKTIKRRFGSTCGSSELRDLRQEILQNTLERYDEEIASGAGEQEAYDRAAASVGDMKELLGSLNIPQKKRKRRLAIALPLLALATLLTLIVVIMLREDPFLAIFFGGCTFFGLGLLSFGVLSLIGGIRRKVWSIICTVVGGQIVLYFFLLSAYVLLISLAAGEPFRYDYRDKLDLVSSVEYVEVTRLPAYPSYEEDFEFRVIKTFSEEEWKPLIDDLAEIEFSRYGNDPSFMTDGARVLMIRFSPSDNGVTFMLIGQSSTCYGERDGSRVRIYDKDSYCSGEDWTALTEKYDLEDNP